MLSEKEQTMNNYEQMCEALVYARTVLAKWSRDTPFRAWNEIGEAIDKCDDALSAPPRQCDVGSPTEQTQRFKEFCEHHRHTDLPQCGGCPLEHLPEGTGCEEAWAQMPYAEGRSEEMKHMITWTEFNRGKDASDLRHSEPKNMTKQEVLDAVAEWYDAIGTGLNDFDGIQLVCLKCEEGAGK